MFGIPARNKSTDGESRQPLLNHSRDNLVQEDQVIFALDEEDEDEVDDLYGRASHEERPEHSVRFKEEVQVIGPPLRSTIQSRETGESIGSV